MTDPNSATVTQADRELASELCHMSLRGQFTGDMAARVAGYREAATAELTQYIKELESKDDATRHEWTDAERKVTELTAEIARLREALEAAIQWFDADDCSRMGPAEDAAHARIIHRLDAALSAQPSEQEGGE